MPSRADPSKEAARRRGREARRRAARRAPTAGRLACARLRRLPEYLRARSVLWYVSHGAELPTREAIRHELGLGRRVYVPFVDGHGLRLWRLHALEELRPGAFGILEPAPLRRCIGNREVVPEDIDLVVVPGAAFDQQGGRIGSGRGFYDRLLARMRPDCVRVGLCFDAQVAERLPLEAHDQPMDVVVTERRVIRPGGAMRAPPRPVHRLSLRDLPYR